MLKQTVPPSAAIDNKEQLLLATIASLRMLLVSLSFVVLFVVLFCKAIIGFAMVILAALNMLCQYLISIVVSIEEIQDFFIAAGRPI